jgi:hypothetical protein
MHAPVMISCSTPPNMYTSLSSEAVVGSAHVSGGRNGLPPPTVLEVWTDAADMYDGNPATGIQVGASGEERASKHTYAVPTGPALPSDAHTCDRPKSPTASVRGFEALMNTLLALRSRWMTPDCSSP